MWDAIFSWVLFKRFNFRDCLFFLCKLFCFFFIYFFSTGLTVIYSFRLVYYSIVGEFNSLSLHPINDESWLILKSIIFLVLISIFRGSILMWLIFPTPYIICLPLYIKILILFVCVLGGLLGYFVSLVALYFYNKSLNNNNLVSFFIIIWFIPVIFTVFVTKFPLKTGELIKLIDQGWREYSGALGLFKIIKIFTQFYQLIHFNNIKLYLLRFILWFALLLILFLSF